MKVVALAGGVGGAKLADGLAQILPPGSLTVVVNTADDFEHLGLRICPDLDTVCYTLAGLSNPRTGWGRKNETWHCLRELGHLGGPDWFGLGDSDLATHLERTRRLQQGETLSAVTAAFCLRWGIGHTILPMSDDRVATLLATDEGELSFQDYFVRRKCSPRVKAIRFAGAERALPAPGVIDCLESADFIIICPSNPWVSIAPILELKDLRASMIHARCAAISPLVGGRALRGPADKIYLEMGRDPSALEVAKDYLGVAGYFVLDNRDSSLVSAVRELGMQSLVVNTIMRSRRDRIQLARAVLAFLQQAG